MQIKLSIGNCTEESDKGFTAWRELLMNLLVTGAWADACKHIPDLEKDGHQIVFMPFEDKALPCKIDWVEGCICNNLFQSHSIEDFPNLQYIQLTSTGYDRVPLEYIIDHEITINNAKGVYSIPMAEFAVGGVLRILKKFDVFEKQQEQRCWRKQRELGELYGKNVLIVGCGNAGTACAKRFQAFGCEITGASIHSRENCFYNKMVPLEMLDDELPQADIIIVSIDLSDLTRRLFDSDRFCKVKDGAVFVNISRGQIVVQEDLIVHIPRFMGVILDVFEKEPLEANNPLWEYENVIVFPHNSFVGEGNSERLKNNIILNLKDYCS